MNFAEVKSWELLQMQNKTSIDHCFLNIQQKVPLPLIVKEPKPHLSCPQLPVCCQPVSCVHEDFRDAQSLLDGLQLQGQQVAINPVSFECLTEKSEKMCL